MRKSARNRKGGPSDSEHDEGDELAARVCRRRDGLGSLHDWVLRAVELQAAADAALAEDACADAADVAEALVVNVEQGACRVLLGESVTRCALAPDLVTVQQSALAPGDRVQVLRADGHPPLVRAVLPRTTALKRRDPKYGHIERVIAANIDMVVIVVAAVAPPLHASFVDRVLVATRAGGASPAICMNKIDLLTSGALAERERAKVAPYALSGVPIHYCSAETGAGLDELLGALAGNLCVFAGASGVGKSSLLNAMCADLSITTNDVRASDGRGRHTTSASMLYRLPQGALVIDTPGVREFGLVSRDGDDVAAVFPEFAEYAAKCRFTDCSHTHEPDCGVKWAVTRGLVDEERYQRFVKLSP